MAIFSMILAIGLFANVQTFRGAVYRSEVSTIVSLLERARSRAMANSFQTQWSVCYVAPNYVVVKGSTCNTTAIYDSVSANVEVAAASDFVNPAKFPVIVFQQLSGDTTTSADISLVVLQDSQSSTITINHEGSIIW